MRETIHSNLGLTSKGNTVMSVNNAINQKMLYILYLTNIKLSKLQQY